MNAFEILTDESLCEHFITLNTSRDQYLNYLANCDSDDIHGVQQYKDTYEQSRALYSVKRNETLTQFVEYCIDNINHEHIVDIINNLDSLAEFNKTIYQTNIGDKKYLHYHKLYTSASSILCLRFL
jgi:hypothetical protein